MLALAPLPFLALRYRLLPDGLVEVCLLLDLAIAAAIASGRWKSSVGALLVGSVAIALALDVYGVALLLGTIVRTGSDLVGGRLLLSAMETWIANVSGFALVYWYLNEVRRGNDQPPVLLFPEAGEVPVRHNVGDYIFVAATTALAFGPTDTPPANTLTRCAMLAESLISFVIVAVAAARAINAIG